MEGGGLVLKPSDGPVHQWLGEALDGLVLDGVRVAMPVASSNGSWTLDGWGATSFVAGSEPDLSLPSTWLGVMERAVRFTERLLTLDVPPLSTRETIPGRSQIAWLGESGPCVSYLSWPTLRRGCWLSQIRRTNPSLCTAI